MSGNTAVKTTERTLSRVGRRPIPVPANVQVNLEYTQITVKGPKGELVQPLHPEVNVKMENGSILVERASPRKFHRSLHGLTRTLIANAIQGVSEGYQKTLQLMGVGYRVQQRGPGITLNVGHSHPIDVDPPEGIVLTVEGNNRVHVSGFDKQKVGEVAANIRKARPPNAYKEKGIRYSDEILHLKPGKAAGRKA